MRSNDEYIHRPGRRANPPLSGFLWAERLQTEEVESVEGPGQCPSQRQDWLRPRAHRHERLETEMIDSFLFVVRVLGNDPNDWHFRYFERERSWNASWASQRIDVGTVIAVRPVSGVRQSKTSHFRQFRWDEIVAIGRPLDEDDYPDMLPAPGWVLLRWMLTRSRPRARGSFWAAPSTNDWPTGGWIGNCRCSAMGLEVEYSVALGIASGPPTIVAQVLPSGLTSTAASVRAL